MDPENWFRRIELDLLMRKINKNHSKYCLMATALPGEVCKFIPIKKEGLMYGCAKKAILQQYGLSPSDRI
uniref:Uncharacterized protein n=1 Tax=Lepeophtheirus salmonis TaxID=72036 RepID=A0A0K2TGP8_LEPSM